MSKTLFFVIFFIDFELLVNENVLIPRPETEELVRWIESEIENNATILDIGTGSGCIPLGLKYLNNSLAVSACDISVEALKVAKKNTKLLKLAVNFFELDILNPQTTLNQKFDIIVSNPPYVRESEKARMAPNVLEHEPHLALFVENDSPLVFYKAIVDLSKQSLKKEGLLYFEINEFLGAETKTLFATDDFDDVQLKTDIFDKHRMIRATKR